ncbi:uncharacterized protein DS421_4g129410 [Arachis hypogaea]|nr:uncharacterized protein DS421_4g129410 [Arachis hypogaea]
MPFIHHLSSFVLFPSTIQTEKRESKPRKKNRGKDGERRGRRREEEEEAPPARKDVVADVLSFGADSFSVALFLAQRRPAFFLSRSAPPPFCLMQDCASILPPFHVAPPSRSILLSVLFFCFSVLLPGAHLFLDLFM